MKFWTLKMRSRLDRVRQLFDIDVFNLENEARLMSVLI
jgi:hypothetical protein